MKDTDFLKLERISEDEQARLFEIVADGGDAAQEAAHKIALGNVKLIPGALKKVYLSGSCAFDYEDALIEGYIGLYKAVLGYRPEQGYKFSTYAMMSIIHNIQRHHDDQHRAIRVPIHRVVAARQHITSHSNSRDLDMNEVWLTRPLPSAGLVEGYYDVQREIIEWERSLSHLFVREFRDMFEATTNDERLWMILEARSGMYAEVQILDALAKKLGMTRERVRQLEVKAREHGLWILQTYYPHLVPRRYSEPAAPQGRNRPGRPRKEHILEIQGVESLYEPMTAPYEPEPVVFDAAWEEAFLAVREMLSETSPSASH